MPTMEQPLCTNQMTEAQPPCGVPMFRIGKDETSFAFVCPICDGGIGSFDPIYTIENSLDAPAQDV